MTDVLSRLRSSEHDVVCPCLDLRKAAAAEIAQLRGTLSLAEEGLANYAQENEQLRAALQDLANCCGHDDDKALLLALRNAAKALVPCSREPQSGKQV
jgi:hypothetical protein